MRKVLGVILVAIPVVAIFSLIARNEGLAGLLFCLAFVTVVVVPIAAGTYLLVMPPKPPEERQKHWDAIIREYFQ